jgi:ATP-dependent Lon protease
LLGPWKFRDLLAEKKNEVGAAVGLAWTEVGGQILTTECTLMEGQRQADHHRQAGRRDAGIGAGGA